MLRHGPVALLPVELLVRRAMQSSDHVPRRAATALAHLNAALGELDHHVIWCEVLHAFSAVPLAGDLVDLSASSTTLVRRSQLDRNVVGVGRLVCIDMTELLGWTEHMM